MERRHPKREHLLYQNQSDRVYHKFWRKHNLKRDPQGFAKLMYFGRALGMKKKTKTIWMVCFVLMLFNVPENSFQLCADTPY